MPFGIQPIHIIIVIAVALIIFGPSKLPEMGRGLGKAITEFRRGTQEMTESFKQEISKPLDENSSAANPVAVPPNAVPVASTQVCPQCQAANPLNARFCNSCGSTLSAPLP